MGKYKSMDNLANIAKDAKNLAKDLHDGVSQELVSILWSLESLDQIDDQETIKEEVNKISNHLRTTINDLQRVIYGLEPTFIEELGLSEGIKCWAEEKLAQYDISFIFQNNCEIINVSHYISEHIFRIFQEGINNAIKHAGPDQISLKIYRENNQLHFELTDDGNGFKPDTISTGLGIRNMEERAARLDARFQLDSYKGKGTTLKLSLNVRD